jgi:hypothetical protein
MLKLAHKTANVIDKPAVVALDAYFSSQAAWEAADQTVTENGVKLVEIVTRAQSNTVAYRLPVPPEKPKRGKPRIYGDKVVLKGLYSDTSIFTQTTMTLYNKKTSVKYLCLDLLWKPVKRLVRFVVVESDSGRCVLMSSNLSLSAEDIINIYALRFKIETSFDEQKNDMGCFDYHFWTTALPKCKKWQKIESKIDNDLKSKIINTQKAAQSFVCLSTITAGILTIIAFSHNTTIWNRYPGWIRTLRSTIPSIAIVKETLEHDFNALFDRKSALSILKFIIPLRRINDFLFLNVA